MSDNPDEVSSIEGSDTLRNGVKTLVDLNIRYNKNLSDNLSDIKDENKIQDITNKIVDNILKDPDKIADKVKNFMMQDADEFGKSIMDAANSITKGSNEIEAENDFNNSMLKGIGEIGIGIDD